MKTVWYDLRCLEVFLIKTEPVQELSIRELISLKQRMPARIDVGLLLMQHSSSWYLFQSLQTVDLNGQA